MDTLHYKTVVNDPDLKWVVFIHGAGGSIKTWSYQEKGLQDHYNLLLIDLRDHGESKNLMPAYMRYRFEIISADIKAVMDQVGIQQAHFITLSFGSVLIQDFSMRYPEMIDRVIIAGGIFKGTLALKFFVHFARVMNLVLSYPAMYRLFSYLLMPKLRNQKARRLYQIQAQKLTQSEYMKWIGLYGEFFRLLKVFYRHSLLKPTLVIMGSEDYIFLNSAKEFVKRQSSASLETLKHTGHICNIEQPLAFNKLAVQFLSSK